MIFEIRTYLLKPGTALKAEEAFAERIEARTKLSRIGGFWRTEVGTLNQIIHAWPYADLNERDRIRAEAIEKNVWPPKIADYVLDMDSKILYAAPFSPGFEPGEHGGLYEFRTYSFVGVRNIPKVMEAWSPLIKERSAISPLIFAGYTQIGLLNQWLSVWAYKSMSDREERHAQAAKFGHWPPPLPDSVAMRGQESMFAVPASWSPLR